MSLRTLIVALNRSDLDISRNFKKSLWRAKSRSLPSDALEVILDALEKSESEHPEILSEIISICACELTSMELKMVNSKI